MLFAVIVAVNFGLKVEGIHNIGWFINVKFKYQLDAQSLLESFLINYHKESRAGLVPFPVVGVGDGRDINRNWQGKFIRSGNKELAFKLCVPGIANKYGP